MAGPTPAIVLYGPLRYARLRFAAVEGEPRFPSVLLRPRLQSWECPRNSVT
jgi:hypothetical protein